MPEPITLIALTAFIVKHAPSWYTSLRGTVLDKSREVAIDKSKEVVVTRGGRLMQRVFHLDEKEQLRHLEQALKNATERGLAPFDTLPERDQYKDIVRTLSQEGPQGEVLRREVMHLFTLSEKPDFVVLSNTYNQRQRFFNAAHQDIDVAPYLNSFFHALLGELYADPYFRTQLSDVLQLRATAGMQQSLLDIVSLLKSIGEALEDRYSTEDLARDVATYTSHIERSVRNLKIVGVVPKDQNSDPEISGIFVPLRIASHEQTSAPHQFPDAIVAALEQYPYLVMLGGPGSGKSTATKHLAWSHAAANQSLLPLTSTPLLSGNPLPLRIELRRLNEERKRTNYNFLTFVTEVLLKREGVEINQQMFVELLKRRCMLLLFDGLDEVATLDERLGLVGEIEHFALCYPGNRVLVTSRPVGYDLARVSHPLFFHAQVQNFNDEQIQQFLENWYTAVLRLSPIPQRDQEELDLLLTTLKENPRLHRLAENPLLLTVITALHRYERLPDRRVQVYDRCAELLLETWAKLRGTDKRWTGMKMIKEEQYACVAYLAFLLHERSQEETSDDEDDEDITVDVTARFLRQNIEDFLKKRELIVGVAEQKTEAKLFIELIQEEAGLIVERGTDENGEALYSFVHRTFQEYFAAADVYERYQQQEDACVISDFLTKHLHDPHWSEVILLLLGKLKSKPVTNQLRQILEGKIKSRRSRYTEILHQDLFFVCNCLIEEIKVENTLVGMVVSALKDVVKSTRFSSQRRKALRYLEKLIKTRQYAEKGQRALIALATTDDVSNLAAKLDAVKTLYLNSPVLSEHKSLANQVLTSLLVHSDLSVELILEIVMSLDLNYYFDFFDFQGKQMVTYVYQILLKDSNLAVDQVPVITFVAFDPTDIFFIRSLEMRHYLSSESQQLAIKVLTSLLQRSNLSIDQTRQIAMFLYCSSNSHPETQHMATRILTSLLERPDLSIDQTWQIATSLYLNGSTSESQLLAVKILITLLDSPDLSIDQTSQTTDSLFFRYSSIGSRKLGVKILTSLLERPDLSIDQIRQIADILSRENSIDSENHKLGVKILTSLLERPNLSIDQIRQIAESLSRKNSVDSENHKLGVKILTSLLERPDLSINQTQQIAESLSRENHKLGVKILTSLLERPDLFIDQTQQIAESLFAYSSPGSQTQQFATSMLSSLLKRSDLSINQTQQIAESLYHYSPEGSEVRLLAISMLLALLSSSSELEDTENLYNILQSMIPQFHNLPPLNMPQSSNV